MSGGGMEKKRKEERKNGETDADDVRGKTTPSPPHPLTPSHSHAPVLTANGLFKHYPTADGKLEVLSGLIYDMPEYRL